MNEKCQKQFPVKEIPAPCALLDYPYVTLSHKGTLLLKQRAPFQKKFSSIYFIFNNQFLNFHFWWWTYFHIFYASVLWHIIHMCVMSTVNLDCENKNLKRNAYNVLRSFLWNTALQIKTVKNWKLDCMNSIF